MTEEKFYIISIIELASDPGAYISQPAYVRDGDANFIPEWMSNSRLCGIVIRTSDITKAKLFPTREDAVTWYCTQSTRIPFREDGLPNRPFTAYTVIFEPVIRSSHD